MGQATVHVNYKGKSTLLQLLVAENGNSVLGRLWIRALHIVSLCKLCDDAAPYANVHHLRDDMPIQNLLNSFPQVFQPGLCHCTKMKAHLILKNEAPLMFIQPQSLPCAVYNNMTAELE
uniref:Uncharacterized protein n=1 Tax=Plectus sambesii TaxID=2011161 RepID=A0A914WLN0_9BILA